MPVDINRTLSDRLRELGNIGCGRALTSLSLLTDADFTIHVPEIAFVDYNSIPRLIGDAREEMVGVMLDISGDLRGVFLLLLRPAFADCILEAMRVGVPDDYRALPPRARSALLELGNIMCNAYMTAVAEMTGMDIAFSVPSCAADMLGALLNAPIVRFAASDSQMLYIQNVFTITGRDWVGSTLLLPELSSADTLAQRLGERI